MDRPGPPDAATLARRLRRERAARREAEVVAEQVTRELYETVQQLAAFKAVLDATTDFVAIADLDGRPLYLNRALCAFLGVQGGDVDGGNVVDLLTARSRARYLEEAVPALHQVGRWRGEFAWARPGGGEAVVSQVLIAHRSPDGQIDRVSSISRDVTEQQALQEQLAHQALHDPLTGLANRRLFFDRLDLARARARRSGSVLGVLFMDLDGFKAINDTLGHEAGDEVLVTVAGRLRAAMRAADTLARLGGDEFAILCEDLTGPDDLIRIAERLTKVVGQPFQVEGTPVSVGMSTGIAVAAQPAGNADELLRQADAAMYQAKRAGKRRWQLFDPTTQDRL
jgi:diguanylate cyclase (GGDEF)-like protein/PAS domain S-box-containing protein